MRRMRGIVGGVCAFISSVIFLSATVGQAGYSLEAQIARELDFPESGFSTQLRNALPRKHAVFVDGIMNELAKYAGNYYSDNIRELWRLGISSSHFGLSSRVSIEENGEIL